MTQGGSAGGAERDCVMRRQSICLAVFVVGLLGPARADAQADQRERARSLFEQGLHLVEQERWEDALEAFDESIRLYPTQSATYNRALCLGLMGRPAEGVRALGAYLRQYGGQITEERQAEVDRELASLRQRVGRIDVRIQGAPAATVLLNGEDVGQAPLARPLEVNPGRHHVTVQAPDFDAVARWVNVGAGDVLSLVIALDRGEATEERVSGGQVTTTTTVATDGTPQQPVTPTEPRRNRGLLIGGWVSTGVAVAALGAALGLFLWNNSSHDTWEVEHASLTNAYTATESAPQDARSLGDRVDTNNELGSRIRTIDAVSAAMLGVGTAAAAAAVVLIVLGYRGVGASANTSARHVAFFPTPGGLVLSAGWTTP